MWLCNTFSFRCVELNWAQFHVQPILVVDCETCVLYLYHLKYVIRKSQYYYLRIQSIALLCQPHECDSKQMIPA